jgi:glucosamine--fructose-6-phosphate aminotransferase (isomerizing)
LREVIGHVDLGPFRAGTVVFSGIGASAHAVKPAVLSLRAAGRRAFAVSSADLGNVRSAGLADAFVLVSQSGASVETVGALAQLDGAPVIAVTGNDDSPLARAATACLPLGPMADTPVATLSYTATLQALGMLCDALRGLEDRTHWDALAGLAEEVLAGAEAMARHVAQCFDQVFTLDAVGGGVGHASAGETALLAREGLRLPAAGIETREYLHGVLESVGPGFGAILFGRDRERALAEELFGYGATVALVSDLSVGGSGNGSRRSTIARPVDGGVAQIALPQVPDLMLPILQILPIQLIFDDLAGLRGLPIGQLHRHATDIKLG